MIIDDLLINLADEIGGAGSSSSPIIGNKPSLSMKYPPPSSDSFKWWEDGKKIDVNRRLIILNENLLEPMKPKNPFEDEDFNDFQSFNQPSNIVSNVARPSNQPKNSSK